jgi:hypothetical protein
MVKFYKKIVIAKDTWIELVKPSREVFFGNTVEMLAKECLNCQKSFGLLCGHLKKKFCRAWE